MCPIERTRAVSVVPDAERISGAIPGRVHPSLLDPRKSLSVREDSLQQETYLNVFVGIGTIIVRILPCPWHPWIIRLKGNPGGTCQALMRVSPLRCLVHRRSE